MAEIKTLTYSRTINLGNYESERLEATVELQQYYDMVDGVITPRPHDPQASAEAFKELKEWVLQQIYAKASSTENPKTITTPDPDNYGKFIEQPFPDLSPSD